MTEPTPSPDRTPLTKRPGAVEDDSAPPGAARHGPLAWFTAAGFVISAIAVFWLWHRPPAAGLADARQVLALEQRLDALQARVDQMANAPPAVDPAPLLARIGALEARAPTGPTTTGSATTGPAPDLAPIEARIAGLEASVSAADAGLRQSLGRVARLEAAAMALATGRKLGPIPDAPAELQRFADAAPPTEASLRLAFPAAARAALAARGKPDPDQPWLARIWQRMQALVTVRDGERVILGDPAAGTIALAQRSLDAGDLAGAVTLLGHLPPAASAAMAGWMDEAQALLAARAALAVMAGHG